MARPLARRSPCRNLLPTGKDKPAGPAPIEGSNTYTTTPAVSRAPTHAPPVAFASVPALAPTTINLMVRYSEADLQQIFRTVLKTRRHASAPQPLVFSDGLCKRPWKARFPELYCGKTHIEYYNFIQQCENHFATARAKRPNRMPFAATFL